jgi:hypothetical protein
VLMEVVTERGRWPPALLRNAARISPSPDISWWDKRTHGVVNFRRLGAWLHGNGRFSLFTGPGPRVLWEPVSCDNAEESRNPNTHFSSPPGLAEGRASYQTRPRSPPLYLPIGDQVKVWHCSKRKLKFERHVMQPSLLFDVSQNFGPA